MSFGQEIEEKVLVEYKNIKDGKVKYLICGMDNLEENIIVSKVGNIKETHDEFLSSLPKNDCKYAILLFPYQNENKIIFVFWFYFFFIFKGS
jgi:hypothetical protein